MKLLAVIVALLVAPGLAMAQDSNDAFLAEVRTKLDRFHLWNACEPVSLFVKELGDHASKIGLTEERIETLVRSRLRAARIYHKYRSAYLYINVSMVGNAYNVNLFLYKSVTDMSSNVRASAITWNISSTGTHGQDASFILQQISELIDKFIDEYLRVNAKACR